MLIGELSKKSGLSRHTIRFYEKHGLIAVGKKERRFNNYKEYSEETLNRLFSIKLIKSMGFTLNEIHDLLEMIDANEASCKNVAEKIESKVQVLDEKIKELLNIRKMLVEGVKNCKGTCNPEEPEANCPIIVPEKCN
jgi:DNA-binding transcriptional MerR regulator